MKKVFTFIFLILSFNFLTTQAMKKRVILRRTLPVLAATSKYPHNQLFSKSVPFVYYSNSKNPSPTLHVSIGQYIKTRQELEQKIFTQENKSCLSFASAATLWPIAEVLTNYDYTLPATGLTIGALTSAGLGSMYLLRSLGLYANKTVNRIALWHTLYTNKKKYGPGCVITSLRAYNDHVTKHIADTLENKEKRISINNNSPFIH